MAIQHLTQPPTIVPVTFVYPGGEDIADIEATDAVILSEHLEQIDVGGAGPLHGVYLRLSAPDLVAVAEELRRLSDRIIDAVLDARQDRLDAQRHVCPGCPTMLEPDEVTCGDRRCEAEHARDCAGQP